jgi:hypothetical protein
VVHRVCRVCDALMEFHAITSATIQGKSISRIWLGRRNVWPDPWEDIWAEGGIPASELKEP